MQKNHLIHEILLFCADTCMASFSGRGKYARDFKKDDLLSQDTRNSIFQLIKDNEGLHFRKICRMLDKKMGVVQYHVSVLEKSGMIRAVRDGRYKCFFPTDTLKNSNIAPELRNKEESQLRETIVTSMRRKTPQVLIQHLASNKQASHQVLSDIAQVSPQAITFHTQRLASFNIIKAEKDGRQKFYSLTEQAQKIVDNLSFTH
jgi:predicted transcriptional regulator